MVVVALTRWKREGMNIHRNVTEIMVETFIGTETETEIGTGTETGTGRVAAGTGGCPMHHEYPPTYVRYVVRKEGRRARVWGRRAAADIVCRRSFTD